MEPFTFEQLLLTTITEFKEKNSLFGVPVYRYKNFNNVTQFCGQMLEAPFGPAAGPHTQLANNIISAYGAGARYFELKTVQVLDGDDLNIEKPCIYLNEEAYNVEWSTELKINKALEEYVKAWFILKIISKEFNLGTECGFIFNFSVGYNLEGIQSEKVDNFINNIKDASKTKIWMECVKVAKKYLYMFTNITQEYIDGISPNICNSVTISTMHGCPSSQICNILKYLIKEKQLNTIIKCNPTLLGKNKVKEILINLGYEDIEIDDLNFDNDISFEEMVDAIKIIKEYAHKNNKKFSVKLTNTLPTINNGNNLYGDSTYMSGKALFPLAINVADKLSKEFNGQLKISFSAGINENNIKDVFETGISPITATTRLLEPGGYKNLSKFAQKFEDELHQDSNGIELSSLEKLAKDSLTNKMYRKKNINRKEKLKKDKVLNCNFCNNCKDVCPNRANSYIHIDSLCNQCGNCSCSCPFGRNPYLDKITLFSNENKLINSDNNGFVYLGDNLFIVKSNGQIKKGNIDELDIDNEFKEVLLKYLDERRQGICLL